MRPVLSEAATIRIRPSGPDEPQSVPASGVFWAPDASELPASVLTGVPTQLVGS